MRVFPGFFLPHVGCLLVLIGGYTGSTRATCLMGQEGLIRHASMVIFEGRSENRVVPTGADYSLPLPFKLRLIDFELVFYDRGWILLEKSEIRIADIPGTEYKFNDGTILRVIKKYDNFHFDTNTQQAYEDPNSGHNPAIEIELGFSSGNTMRKYLFAKLEGQNDADIPLLYTREIKDYISHIEVIQDSKVVKRAPIEVNHPLYFDGFLFSQQSYDSQSGSFTVLNVRSARGLAAVFTGYALLLSGLIWHFWLRHLFFRKDSVN